MPRQWLVHSGCPRPGNRPSPQHSTEDRLRAAIERFLDLALGRLRMQPETHPLESFFHQAVRNSYEGKLGLNDPEVTGYVAHLLCEFSQSDKLYKVRDEMGRPVA